MTRSACITLAALALAGCINDDLTLYEFELRGTVSVADGLPTTGDLHLELHHAESGAGRFSYPLGQFAAFPDVGSPDAELTVTARAPIDEGNGLVVYAWLDVDGDGMLCAPGVVDEPAGLVEVDTFPAHALRFTLTLTSPCSGPEALYP
ncbi:MAG: hypothetical protein H0T76_18095 [Nannocystis sp.]|nr:hypothetical protein [Nannocystis sp.]MBA3548398.1 hypothetical protein [Nannocystis sp.]